MIQLGFETTLNDRGEEFEENVEAGKGTVVGTVMNVALFEQADYASSEIFFGDGPGGPPVVEDGKDQTEVRM